MAHDVIDTLQININANAESSQKSIDELIEALIRLKKELKIPNGKDVGKVDAKSYDNAKRKVLGLAEALGKNLVKGYAKALASGAKMAANMSGLTGTVNRFKTAFAKLTGTFQKNHKSATSFLGTIGKLYAAFWALRTAFGWLSDSITFASDLVEVQNVVRNAFGPEAEKMVNDFAGSVSMLNFGLSELTTKEIASKFQAMGVALGVSNQQVKATQKTISGLPESYDAVADSMADVSLNLTKLAADMGSFYNKNPEDVAKSLEAIFTGQTRPLRQYGIDLTQATLQEWAMKQGIDADIASMTQAEKTMLRYQYVMNNARLSMGDFAKTADTWANVVKTLKQQFQALGGTIGTVFVNAFKPALIALRNFMQNVLDFAKTVADALGSIFGWTMEITASGGGGVADAFDGLADSMDDVGSGAGDAADGLGGAAKSAEKIKKNLTVLPFDELNQLSKDADSSGSGGGGGSGGSGGGSGGGLGGMSGSGATASLVRTDSVLEKIKSNIKTLEELGAYISDALTNAMMSIDWDGIYEKARNFGTGLAEFLNGLITPELFGAIGHTLAGALNTALNAAEAFAEEFNFTKLGTSIATGINRFASDTDLNLAVSAFVGWANGILDTLIEAVGTVQWGMIGGKISAALDDGDFEVVAAKIGELISTKFQSSTTFIASFNWSGLGEKLGKSLEAFFSNLKLENVGASLATAGNAIVSFLGRAVSNVDFKDVGASLGKGINTFFSTFSFKDLAAATSNVAKGILQFITSAIEEVDWMKVGKSIGDLILGIDWIGIIGNSARLIFDIAAALLTAVLGAIASLAEHAAELGKAMFQILSDAFGNYDFNLVKHLFGNFGTEAKMMVNTIEIMASEIRQKLDEMLLSFAKEHPNIASMLGIEKQKLELDVEAQIKKQTDLRKKRDKYLEETGRIDEQEDNLRPNDRDIPMRADLTERNVSNKAAAPLQLIALLMNQQKAPGFNSVIGGMVAMLQSKEKGNNWSNTIDNMKARMQDKEKGGNWSNLIDNMKARLQNKEKGNSWSNAIDNMKAVFQNKEKGKNFNNTLDNMKAKITDATITGDIHVKGGRIMMAGGGMYQHGKWHPIQQYASGGRPNTGQLFIAREAGPELVGQLKGSGTAVMNNNQIVSSVADGVARSISNIRFQMTGFRPPEIDMRVLTGAIEYAVASALANNNTQRPIDVYATIKTQNDEVLARAVARGNQQMVYRDSAVGA